MARTAAKKEAKEDKVSNSFKTSADVENFYRFIYENNLRRDAKFILEQIVKAVKPPKKKRRKKKVQ